MNYEGFINNIVSRVLTQVDRDKDSMTYGSCDRNHWHLKMRDFSSAILQQTGLSLAMLYQLDFEGNICREKECVKEWATACVKYWVKIQLSDGSFNEYYPNEHGFPPTAFSLYGICETYRRMKLDDKDVLQALKKTGRYLVSHTEKKAFNQEIASITALYSLYLVTNETWVLEGLQRKLDRVLLLQSEEGWFPEYGGADIGYLSVSFDMMAEYYWLSKDEKVLAALDKMLDFIQYFVHPDGTVGGEYGSRNTTYFLPNGLEVMVQLGNVKAKAIKVLLYHQTSSGYYFLDGVDERYCSHYVLHSFLRALEKEMNGKMLVGEYKLPHQRECTKYFKEAGFYIRSWKNIYAVVGLKKGGVVKVFSHDREVGIDCGWRVRLKEGVVAATNWQDDSYKIKIEKDRMLITGQMNKVSQKIPTPFLHFGLRVAAKIAGNRIIGLLKGKMILIDKHADIKFTRTILFKSDGVIIEDLLKSPKKVIFYRAGNFSLRHVASGKFFTLSDLIDTDDRQYQNLREIKSGRCICVTSEGRLLGDYEKGEYSGA